MEMPLSPVISNFENKHPHQNYFPALGPYPSLSMNSSELQVTFSISKKHGSQEAVHVSISDNPFFFYDRLLLAVCLVLSQQLLAI